ncbi:MAG: hypothetical protein COB50_02245 [Thiotrichales bacterium]|nr:MAG: hypothetical protein COB50_02245 [Thiotrichales bacterium]
MEKKLNDKQTKILSSLEKIGIEGYKAILKIILQTLEYSQYSELLEIDMPTLLVNIKEFCIHNQDLMADYYKVFNILSRLHSFDLMDVIDTEETKIIIFLIISNNKIPN